MPEWRRLIRERLRDIDLPPADEIGIVEELAHHLDDRYRDLLASGRSNDDAVKISLEELADDFGSEIKNALDGKDNGDGNDEGPA
jgi:hypothetical protein